MLAPTSLSDKLTAHVLFQVPYHFVDDPVANEYAAFFRFTGLVGDPGTRRITGLAR